MTDTKRLLVDCQTLFQLTETGRIARENDADRSLGPRFWLAGCTSGNVFAVRHDVGEEYFESIASLVADEPPLVGRGNYPRHFERYAELLTVNSVAPKGSLGLIYELPNEMTYAADAHTVDSDSGEGARLRETWAMQGMPHSLRELGFHTVADLWEPWCIVFEDKKVASIAFAARLCATGAELGLVTVPVFRGRGYGAVATAAWTRLPSLRSRLLFYSTEQSNLSSQRVIQRLGLRYLGSSLRLS